MAATGSRVVDVILDDGTVVVSDGVIVDGPAIAVATNDFSARGGDQYPFGGLPFTTVCTDTEAPQPVGCGASVLWLIGRSRP